MPVHEEMPDLASPTKFHHWLTQRISRGDESDLILEELAQIHSDMSLCRQMIVAYQGGLATERDVFIEECLSVSDARVEAYAQALSSYLRIAERSATQHRYNAPAYHLRPMLEGVLTGLLAASRDPFTREVECALRIALAAAYLLQGRTSEAAQEASKSYYWAERLMIPFATARAKTLLVSVTLADGKIADTLVMANEAIDDPNQTVSSRQYLEHLETSLLVQLGQRESVLKLLKERLCTQPDPIRANAAQLQRQQLILGVGGLGGEVVKTIPEKSAETWLAKSMRCLVKVLGLPRTNQTLAERTDLLNEAINLWKEEEQLRHNWAKLMGRWIVGKAYLLLGRPLGAMSMLSGMDLQGCGWFDLRLLKVGLELEVALHLDCPDVALHSLEDELRTIFTQVRQIPFASAEGLAERLIHWHPVAAAYGALMPDPILELHPIVAAVLQVGSKNRVYGEVIPPTYATELALRSLDVDVRLKKGFVQSDPGGGRYKKSMLLNTYGEVDFWRPAISAARIVYGLVKAGHLERARAVYTEFGVTPKSDAGYIMMALVQDIEACIEKLLNGTLTPSSYAEVVGELL